MTTEMVPLLGILDLQKALRAALYNTEQFNLVAYDGWVKTRNAAIQKAARARPPNRIYKVEEYYCVVKGYTADGLVVVEALGQAEATPFSVDVGSLEDVTDDVRKRLEGRT